MNGELTWILSLLAVTIVLFATDGVYIDAVILFVIVAFVLSGVLTVSEVLSGFSDPSIILVAASSIIGDGLVRTGITTVMGAWLVKVTGNSGIKMLVPLMLTVVELGVLMSSTGIVTIFIPAVLSVAIRTRTLSLHPVIPLSSAGPISSVMTLVVMPPNLVANSELLRRDYCGFSFFSATPVNLVVLVLGISYILVMRFMLRGDTQAPQCKGQTCRTFCDLIREYQLAGCMRHLATRLRSPIIGQRLDDPKLHERYGASVVSVEHWRRFRYVIVNTNGVSELHAHDALLIDMSAANISLRQFYSEQLLKPMVLCDGYFSDQALNVGMAEISLIPGSELTDESVREIGFHTCYRLNVVGLKRDGVTLEGLLVDRPPLLDDIILIVGNWKLVGMLAKQGRDFIVLSLPEKVSEASPTCSQAPHAIFCLALMMALMLTDKILSPVTAIIACLLMGKFYCIDAKNVYKSIHWPSIILIVGMMPFAVALQKTGGIALAAKGLMSIGGGYGPHMMLGCLFVLPAVVGLFISNTAAAVLMAPIALAAAKAIGVSPCPFVMAVAMAASAVFIALIFSPVNILVLGPGDYSSSDFIRLGVPLTIIVMTVCMVIIPMLLPFRQEPDVAFGVYRLMRRRFRLLTAVSPG